MTDLEKRIAFLERDIMFAKAILLRNETIQNSLKLELGSKGLLKWYKKNKELLLTSIWDYVEE